MQNDIARQVVEIIAQQASVDAASIVPETTLEELGIDSLGVVEAIFAIEERFSVEVPFNANDPSASDFDISCVDTIVQAVRGLVRQSAS